MESTTTTTWQAELTDTFGGQANYSWVRREEFNAPAGADQRTIVRLGKAALGLTGAPCRTSDCGEGYELRPSGSATVAFLLPVY